MIGFINVNKPAGITSRDAVNKIHRLVRPTKVGHCGTLDPLATGVLVVCIGQATRLANYVQQSRKVYLGQFRLGCESPTEDIEGEVQTLEDAPMILEQDLERVLPEFCGTIEQHPPRFSALRVNGKRAYELARKGVEVELKPRSVSIKRIELRAFSYPHFTIEVECGAGTYIRSLGRDIGRRLNSGAVMTALNRTAIGNFGIEDAVDPDLVTRENINSHLNSPLKGLDHLPVATLTSEQSSLIPFGAFVDFGETFDALEVVAVSESREVLAVLKRREDGRYMPAINFVGKN